MVLAAGMVAIELGAMLMVLGAQNRATTDADRRRLGLIFAYASGIVLTMHTILIEEDAAFGNEMHGSAFYKLTAVVVPILLVAFARGSRLKWPATTTALLYMGIVLINIWVTELFPAQPRLAPIYNPVTHMVPSPFPVASRISGDRNRSVDAAVWICERLDAFSRDRRCVCCRDDRGALVLGNVPPLAVRAESSICSRSVGLLEQARPLALPALESRQRRERKLQHSVAPEGSRYRNYLRDHFFPNRFVVGQRNVTYQEMKLQLRETSEQPTALSANSHELQTPGRFD
jgi:hypothetical protein